MVFLVCPPSFGCSESGRGLGNDLPPASAFLQWASSYQSDSDSDADRPEPDLVQDDQSSRRFRSVTSVTPVNFAIPSKPLGPRVVPMVTPSARKSWLTLSDASRLAAVPPQRTNQRSEFRECFKYRLCLPWCPNICAYVHPTGPNYFLFICWL